MTFLHESVSYLTKAVAFYFAIVATTVAYSIQNTIPSFIINVVVALSGISVCGGWFIIAAMLRYSRTCERCLGLLGPESFAAVEAAESFRTLRRVMWGVGILSTIVIVIVCQGLRWVKVP